MGDTNYVVGRGKVYLDGRYIGNTSSVKLMSPTQLRVVCENISDENLQMLLRRDGVSHTVTFEPAAPIGLLPRFIAFGTLTFEPLELKSEGFMFFVFAVDGSIKLVQPEAES